MSEGVASIGSKMSFSAALPAAHTSVGFEALTFIESAEATQIGDIGPENEVITYNTVGNGKVNKRMGATNFGSQSLELAYDKGAGAQTIVSDAAISKDKIAVKEELATGDIMYFTVYVSSFKTQVGGSSDFLRAAVNLEVDDEIIDG